MNFKNTFANFSSLLFNGKPFNPKELVEKQHHKSLSLGIGSICLVVFMLFIDTIFLSFLPVEIDGLNGDLRDLNNANIAFIKNRDIIAALELNQEANIIYNEIKKNDYSDGSINHIIVNSTIEKFELLLKKINETENSEIMEQSEKGIMFLLKLLKASINDTNVTKEEAEILNSISGLYPKEIIHDLSPIAKFTTTNQVLQDQKILEAVKEIVQENEVNLKELIDREIDSVMGYHIIYNITVSYTCKIFGIPAPIVSTFIGIGYGLPFAILTMHWNDLRLHWLSTKFYYVSLNKDQYELKIRPDISLFRFLFEIHTGFGFIHSLFYLALGVVFYMGEMTIPFYTNILNTSHNIINSNYVFVKTIWLPFHWILKERIPFLYVGAVSFVTNLFGAIIRSLLSLSLKYLYRIEDRFIIGFGRVLDTLYWKFKQFEFFWVSCALLVLGLVFLILYHRETLYENLPTSTKKQKTIFFRITMRIIHFIKKKYWSINILINLFFLSYKWIDENYRFDVVEGLIKLFMPLTGMESLMTETIKDLLINN